MIESARYCGWLATTPHAGRGAYELDTLKAAGRTGGVAGLLAWFEARGIDFLLSETGRELLAWEQRQRGAAA